MTTDPCFPVLKVNLISFLKWYRQKCCKSLMPHFNCHLTCGFFFFLSQYLTQPAACILNTVVVSTAVSNVVEKIKSEWAVQAEPKTPL